MIWSGSSMRLAAYLLASTFSFGASQIRVVSPESLITKLGSNRIYGSTTTIGAPFYGDRVLGRLVHAPSLTGKTYCTAEDYELPSPPSTAESGLQGKLISIALIRRGGCSFSRKVRVAMAKGAHAVVIVDKEDSPYKESDFGNIIVAEDGTAQGIHIPSVFISKDRGRDLIAATQTSQVIIELAWDLPTNHVVQVDLWMSSASRQSMKFLKEFAIMRKALNQVLKFTPHYAIFGLDSNASPESKSRLCSDSSGRYCAEDPDGNGPITGKLVIDEDLRQLCLHELTAVDRPFYIDLTSSSNLSSGSEKGAGTSRAASYSKQFWDYVERFPDECPLDGHALARQFGPRCSNRVMSELGVDTDSVDRCVESTREQKLQEQRKDIAWSPRALRINGWRYSGILEAELVTRAICSGFVNMPSACKALIRPRDPFKHYNTTGKGGITYSQFWGNVLLMAALIGLGSCLYMRNQRKQLRNQIREEVMLEVEAAIGEYSRLRG